MLNNANSYAAWGYQMIIPHQAGDEPFAFTITGVTGMDTLLEKSKRTGKRFTYKLRTGPGNGAPRRDVMTRKIVPAFWTEGVDDKTDNSAAFNADPAALVYLRCDWLAPNDAVARNYFMEFDLEYEVCVYSPTAPNYS